MAVIISKQSFATTSGITTSIGLTAASARSARTGQRSDLCSPVAQRHRPSRRAGRDHPRVPRRRVVHLHASRIVYASGRSVCDHPALAVSIGRPDDDSAIAARHPPPSKTIWGDLPEAGLHLALRQARSEYRCPTPRCSRRAPCEGQHRRTKSSFHGSMRDSVGLPVLSRNRPEGRVVAEMELSAHRTVSFDGGSGAACQRRLKLTLQCSTSALLGCRR